MQNPTLKKRTLQNGSVVWWTRYRDTGGKQKKFSFRGTKSDAQVALNEIIGKVQTDRLGVTEPIRTTGNSLDEFRTKYLEHRFATVRQGTAEKDKFVLLSFYRYAGNIKLNSVNSEMVDQYIQYLLGESKSPVTVNNYIGALKAAWNKAIMWNLIARNPWAKTEKLKTDDEVVYMPEDDIKKFFEYLDEANHHMRDLFSFLILTGARRNEAIFLKWETVNLEEQIIQFPGRTRKTGKTLNFPYQNFHEVKTLLETLYQTRGESDYVFKGAAKPHNDPDYVSHEFKDVVRKLGLNPKYKVHSLRKTFGTRHLKNGTSIHTVQLFLGHKSVTTTEQAYSGVINELAEMKITPLPF